MVAGGVSSWPEGAQVKQLFSMLKDNFPDGEIVFDVRSKLDNNFEAWVDQFPPEQRDAIRITLVDAIKGWREKAPQDKKDTVDDVITALKIPTKPKGKASSYIEAWWNRLSAKEKEEVWRNFRAFPSTGSDRWTLENVSEIAKWDRRVKVIDQFPMFKKYFKRTLIDHRCPTVHGL